MINALIFASALAFAADTPTPSASPTQTGTLTLTNSATQTPTGTSTLTLTDTRTATFTTTQSTSLSVTPTMTETPVLVPPPGFRGFNQLVYAQSTVQAGDTVANTVTETSFFSHFTLAANSLAVGNTIYFTASGTFGTGVSPPNVTIRLRYQSRTVLMGTVTLLASLSGQTWYAEGSFVAVSATGLRGIGNLVCSGITAPLTPATQGSVTFDTTQAGDVTFSATWSVANASNTITQAQFNAILVAP